jgi:hypothetical protein
LWLGNHYNELCKICPELQTTIDAIRSDAWGHTSGRLCYGHEPRLSIENIGLIFLWLNIPSSNSDK